MSAIAHGWRPSGLDIPVKVAKEFHEADAGSKYGAKGRAFGGVAPQLNGMMAQAFNPVMPSPPPTDGQSMGVATPPATMPQPPLSAPGASARGFKQGGTASGGLIKHSGMTTGPLVSTVPGRTDLHLTKVPSGSYVIPADIVSAHGQGNSLAGMAALHKLFKLGEAKASLARGGKADEHVGKPVPVKLAGGEIVVPPSNLHETMQRISGKKLSLDQAHSAMDSWVVNQRKKLRKTLAKLPGPVRN